MPQEMNVAILVFMEAGLLLEVVPIKWFGMQF